MLLNLGHYQICHLATFDITKKKCSTSGTTTAFFSVHITRHTVYLGQIVFVPKGVCPTWYTYLYQEQEKNQPPK